MSTENAKTVKREPLGKRNPNEVNQTLLRVVGNQTKIQPLDVAAFQSNI